ncbi:hypothetical protein V495_03176 [Pseudogymnoascus sp. VKM F-4514 (FW-929)]|nr:hypothetical protein V495_03176 [Pseudogymnoascus sp. VKM F-4514 (FW-929)]KFY62563.1 hypothetical protein V497_02316 [Pseudogymnoascus sp. VKM F-4516 (FW-969)]
MSVAIESQGDLPLQDDLHHAQDAQSDLGDGSSSLSDIEQDADQDDGQDGLDDDIESEEASEEEEEDEEEEENDSEAETERLDISPNKSRAHKDVVLNSHTESHTFERAPSNLQGQYGAEEDEEEESDEEDNAPGDLSDDELSLPDSPKTAAEEEAVADAADDAAAATAQLEETIQQPKDIMHAFDLTNKKRKRSQLLDVDSAGATDDGEPLRKRTGSVQPNADDFAIDDNASAPGDDDTPNPISGDLSDAESVDGQEEDEEAEHADEKVKIQVDEELEDRIEAAEELRTSKRRRKSTQNGKEVAAGEANEPSDKHAVKMPAHASDEGEDAEENAEVEADDAEAALRDEEEQERKRIALEQLTDIERHFSSFRDRLHEDRLAKLNHEEWMLKQDPPIHPEYLAMMHCIDARRDEKLRIEMRRAEYTRETIEKSAVGKRAQILSQFYQEVREIREQKLELLGKQWYEIQHDRRAHGSSVDDYALRYNVKREDQLRDQHAYNLEVSVLSGIAKYRGFPAAPAMAPATSTELEDDFKKMGKSTQKQPQRAQPSLPLQDIAAIRAAASAAALKPAEEQFIEQTPWANPQHPSHVHLLQRQSPAQQGARTGSPFSMAVGAQPRRQSHQQTGLPVSGTFSGINTLSQAQGNNFTGGAGRGQISTFNNAPLPQKMGPSPLGSRRPSILLEQGRVPAAVNEQPKSHENRQTVDAVSEVSHPPLISPPRPQEALHEFSYEGGVGVKREQPATVTNGRF